VKLLKSDDAGAMVSQAVITSGKPTADVMFGIDNTFLCKALEANVFVPYESPALSNVPKDLQLDANHRVTPMDVGDVCVNYWKDSFASGKAPASFDDLTKPEFKGQFVTEHPDTSSPGFAFLLATIAKYGDKGWEGYWRKLRDNDIAIAQGWTDAYSEQFKSGGGDKSIVTSYASSPAAEVVFSEGKLTEPPTGVVNDTCFRQIEFAGVLRGTQHPEAAAAARRLLVVGHGAERHPAEHVRVPREQDGDGARRVLEVREARRQTTHARSGHYRGEPNRLDRTMGEGRTAIAAARRSGSRTPVVRARLAMVAVPLISSRFFAYRRHDPRTRNRRAAVATKTLSTSSPMATAFSAWFHVLAGPSCRPRRPLRRGPTAARAAGSYRFTGKAFDPGRSWWCRSRSRRSSCGGAHQRPDRSVRPRRRAVRLYHTNGAILLAHVIFNVAVIVRVVGGYWALLDQRVDESAQMLGASRWRVFVEIDLPRLRPAITAACAIVFLFCFTSFGVILLLGGPRQATIESEIWRYAVQRTDFHTAALLAAFQLAAVIAMVSAATLLERRLGRLVGRSRLSAPRRASTARERVGLVAGLAPTVVLVALPLAALVERSLVVRGGHGFDNYRALGSRERASSTLLVPPIEAVRNSILTALVATLIAVVVGGLATWCDRLRTARRQPTARYRNDVAARHVRGHAGLRLSHRARRSATRPSHVVDLDPLGASARRHPVRDPHGRAGAARHRRSVARRGHRLGGVAAASVAHVDWPSPRAARRPPPRSRSPSRWASSARHRSWLGPTRRRSRSRSSGS
jgi:ABC transporter substrate-binding protein (ThiB subfamily)